MFLDKYYYPPVHFFTLWFSEAMLYNLHEKGKKITKRSSVMDVGCGLGYHCQIMLNYGVKKVIGVDISSETINLLNTFGTCAVYKKIDICKDNIDEYIESFDTIFSSDVYEHVDNPDLMLMNLNKMLKKGGMISVTFPNWSNHGQNQFSKLSDFENILRKSGFTSYKVDVIKNYSMPYRIFMKLYEYAQKLSDKILCIKRVKYKGTTMPESDEFHEMYAFKKIEKLKKYKYLCISLNISYRIIAMLLRITPPFIKQADNNVNEKRIMVFAQK